MRSDTLFTPDSLTLCWPMCLMSPLIIILIEVTPETAGIWEKHFTLSHTQCPPQSMPVTMGKLCLLTQKYCYNCQLVIWVLFDKVLI